MWVTSWRRLDLLPVPCSTREELGHGNTTAQPECELIAGAQPLAHGNESASGPALMASTTGMDIWALAWTSS